MHYEKLVLVHALLTFLLTLPLVRVLPFELVAFDLRCQFKDLASKPADFLLHHRLVVLFFDFRLQLSLPRTLFILDVPGQFLFLRSIASFKVQASLFTRVEAVAKVSHFFFEILLLRPHHSDFVIKSDPLALPCCMQFHS